MIYCSSCAFHSCNSYGRVCAQFPRCIMACIHWWHTATPFQLLLCISLYLCLNTLLICMHTNYNALWTANKYMKQLKVEIKSLEKSSTLNITSILSGSWGLFQVSFTAMLFYYEVKDENLLTIHLFFAVFVSLSHVFLSRVIILICFIWVKVMIRLSLVFCSVSVEMC